METICNGKIDNNGRCTSCGQISENTSGYCIRFVKYIADELEQQPQEQEKRLHVDFKGLSENINTYIKKHGSISVKFLRELFQDYSEYKKVPKDGVEDCQKAELSAEEMIKELRESNPYPEDVFIPISNEVMASASKILKDLNFSPDAIFGQWGRKVWNNCCDKVEEYAQLEAKDI